MRVVVDTNILVSALLRQGSPPSAVVRSIVGGQLVPVVCAEVLAEYRDVLRRPKFRLLQSDVNALLALIEKLAEHVAAPPYAGSPDVPDVGDWPFIACALAVGCPVITGNRKHFPAQLGLHVVSAQEWATRA